MPCALQSRVFSSESLVAGLDLVKNMSSQPNLEAMDEDEILKTLEALEAGQFSFGYWPIVFPTWISIWELIYTPIIPTHPM